MADICDLHSHILPGMDDGSENVQESEQMLRAAYEQGIRRICATPHYYPVESVDAFLARRQNSYHELTEYLSQSDASYPQICLGAEVEYRPGLEHEENLHKLCLGSSRYLLLEMPFVKWGKDILRGVHNVCNNRGVVPIIAHIERYLGMQSTAAVRQLLELDVLVQMNAGYLLGMFTRRKGCGLLEADVVQLLGSDCHNMATRQPNMGQAIAYLQKCGLTHVLDRVASLSDQVFREAVNKGQ